MASYIKILKCKYFCIYLYIVCIFYALNYCFLYVIVNNKIERDKKHKSQSSNYSYFFSVTHTFFTYIFSLNFSTVSTATAKYILFTFYLHNDKRRPHKSFHDFIAGQRHFIGENNFSIDNDWSIEFIANRNKSQ